MGMKEQLLSKMMSELGPDDVVDLVQTILPKVMDSMDAQERGDFLRKLIETGLSTALEGMDRQERADLMNATLPVLLREFPLEELDILGLFGDMAK